MKNLKINPGMKNTVAKGKLKSDDCGLSSPVIQEIF